MMSMAGQVEKDAMRDSSPTQLLIPSDPVETRRVQDAIESALKALAYDERDIFSIRLAVEEALLNAIKHGNRMDRSKKVHIQYRVRTDHFEVFIADEGSGFDPDDVPDPTAEENLERPSGRGLMLMRHYMTEVCFNPCGNSVCMRKLRNGRK
jgi:serine/threonine-protein kinase RsbW